MQPRQQGLRLDRHEKSTNVLGDALLRPCKTAERSEGTAHTDPQDRMQIETERGYNGLCLPPSFLFALYSSLRTIIFSASINRYVRPRHSEQKALD